MDSALITEKLNQLPANLREEVVDFLNFLLEKNQRQLLANIPAKNRPFGLADGMYEMRPDFDKPLDDFKDYM